MGGCAEFGPHLPELALGILTGFERDRVVDHAASCGECRARLAELASTADELVLLAPEREPSAAFTGRVLDALEIARRGERSRRWVRPLLVAAAVAILVTAFGVGWLASSRAHRPRETATELRTRPMVGASGSAVGSASLYRGEVPWARVSIDYSTLPGGTHAVATTGPAGTRALGAIALDDLGRGAWTGGIPTLEVRTVRIVDSSGDVLCEARFDRRQSRGDSRP